MPEPNPVTQPSPSPTQALLDEVFEYHAPTPEQLPLYQSLRKSAKEFALAVIRACPPGPDRTVALRGIREALMAANASIAVPDQAWKTLTLLAPEDALRDTQEPR